MADLREFSRRDLQETGFALRALGKDGEDVLELVHELDPVAGEVVGSVASNDSSHGKTDTPPALQPSQRSELLLDQEFDPIEEPRVAVPAPENPFFLVSVPGAIDFPAAGSMRSQKPNPSVVRLQAVEKSEPTLSDLLAHARALAADAGASEGRSRSALYKAIERAHDVALAAKAAPDELARLLQSANVSASKKSPATGIAKLVFGGDYDKTRLSEYATVLAHAERLSLGSGALAKMLAIAAGGLKGVVAEERRLRRIEAGAEKRVRTEPNGALVRRLRAMDLQPLTAIAKEGDEFLLVLARRLPDGTTSLIGEVPRDVPLLERAARRFADQAS